jgi:hypothetical protein
MLKKTKKSALQTTKINFKQSPQRKKTRKEIKERERRNFKLFVQHFLIAFRFQNLRSQKLEKGSNDIKFGPFSNSMKSFPFHALFSKTNELNLHSMILPN